MLECIILKVKHCKVHILQTHVSFLINLKDASLSLLEDKENVKFVGV